MTARITATAPTSYSFMAPSILLIKYPAEYISRLLELVKPLLQNVSFQNSRLHGFPSRHLFIPFMALPLL
jgi:hypothetical protein